MFMDISFQLNMLLWISIWISVEFYEYPCFDVLWILDPGYYVTFFVPLFLSQHGCCKPDAAYFSSASTAEELTV